MRREKPNAARDDLAGRFGAPETIAASFLPEGSIGEALRAEKRSL